MKSDKAQLLKRIFVAAATIFVLLAPASKAFSVSRANDLERALVPLGLPQDLWETYSPRNNRQSSEKIELGRKLFFDKRLSRDGSVSCATCHDPDKGFADGKVVSEGIGGKKGPRNSPTVLNAVFNEFQFWDGRVETLWPITARGASR